MKLKFASEPIMWLAACGVALSAAVAEDFAFLHITDTHFPHDPIAADLMVKAPNAQDLIHAPYGVSEKALAFAAVAGRNGVFWRMGQACACARLRHGRGAFVAPRHLQLHPRRGPILQPRRLHSGFYWRTCILPRPRIPDGCIHCGQRPIGIR